MKHTLVNLLLLSATAALFCGTLVGASVLVAGTVPAPFSYYDASSGAAPEGAFSIEQIFTLSSPADLTTLKINAASFSAQTLEVQLFSGLGLEGTGTLLQTFNISVAGGFDGLLMDVPTIAQSISVPLGAGSYSLLLTDPGSSSDLIYLNSAMASNTPAGSLGGTHYSSGIDNPGNIVFELDGSPGSTAPEPKPALLLAAALFLGAGGLIRRRGVDANGH